MRQSGFTLVELAIALMVIGLLIGGVLKGQELIENAKLTATIRQMNAYDTAAMIFRNTYNALPGDIKRPNRIPNCNTDDDAICGIGGNGNGRIHPDDTSPRRIEDFNFFPHLTKAGMIQGPEGGNTTEMSTADKWTISDESSLFYPLAAIESAQISMYGFVSYGANISKKHFYMMYPLTGQQALSLDSKMDDGQSGKGSIAVEDGADCVVGTWPDIEYDTVNGTCGILLEAGF